MVGDTENLAPVPTLATLPPTQHLGPEQPARSPVLPEKGLSADDANTLFGALFPGLMATEPPTVVHPGLPEAVMLEVPAIKQSCDAGVCGRCCAFGGEPVAPPPFLLSFALLQNICVVVGGMGLGLGQGPTPLPLYPLLFSCKKL